MMKGHQVPRAVIIPAHEGSALAQARGLFVEYARGLSFSLDFQNFDEEMRRLPGEYAPPTGRMLLAVVDGAPAGCIALRPFDAGICEMKRLYVRDAHRGLSIGRLLAESLIAGARDAGYERMRLDTAPGMSAAISLYRTLGFREIAPYCVNPLDGAMFFELNLDVRPLLTGS